MPSSITVNGAVISSPGVYTSVDASGLDVTGLTASGIVGVIGTASGGTPYTALNGPQDFVTITNPAQGARLYQSGDLLEAVSIAFNPSSDAAIQGGAQSVVAMQVNPATQASLSFDTGHVVFTAKAYGPAGNKVTVALANGSVSGQMVTITDGTTTEIGDNLSTTDATALTAWINANSQLVTAALTQEAGGGNVNGVILQSTENGVAQGDIFGVVLNSTPYSYQAQVADGVVNVLQALTSSINAGSQGLTATFQQPDPNVSIYQVLVTIPNGRNITASNELLLSATSTFVRGPVGEFNPPALANQAATPLAGGTDGTTTFQDWQNCLNLLKQVRVNSVVVLTTDPAVHAALDAHCAYMCGAGQSERDGFVGIATTQASGLPTRGEILSALGKLNSANIRACAEGIQRYNSQGVLTQFPTYFQALAAAGMQAGSSPGSSLTRKRINVLGVVRDKSWNIVDNKEEMIQAGLLFLENKKGVGIRWVRNVTTYTTDNNSAYSDGGVHNALNFAVYNLREAVDYAIGLEEFAGTNNSILAIAGKQLRLLIAQNVITAYRALAIVPDPDNPDTLLMSVQLAPTQPINFIKFTISLATATTIAAAA